MSSLKNYKTLGVINRTPNSFSDHGISLNQSFFTLQLSTFLNDPTVIVDVGFESTAPMNQAITEDVEMVRFFDFLNASKEFSFKDKIISFDTYRPLSFRKFAREFKKLHPETGLIFNDVSGVLDDELREVLLEFKNENFHYIYTFSHIPERAKVLEHMNYQLPDSDIIKEAAHAFLKARTWFREHNLDSQIIYDPGFGFSKTFDQNWTLINSFESLSKKLNEEAFEAPILIGLSKKSFLKKALGHGGDVDLASLEALHRDCITKIKRSTNIPLLFRVHDLAVL